MKVRPNKVNQISNQRNLYSQDFIKTKIVKNESTESKDQQINKNLITQPSFKNKYLKYKKKYIELKNKLNL